MILTFGKHKGKELTEVPMEYLAWLAGKYDKRENEFVVPESVKEEANKVLDMINIGKERFCGKEGDSIVYCVEPLGDLLYSDGRCFDSFDEALAYCKQKFGYTDPEDNRILIWEILPSGHKKVIWHFSGWHWNSEEFYHEGKVLEQGKYPGDEESAYHIANDGDCDHEEADYNLDEEDYKNIY